MSHFQAAKSHHHHGCEAELAELESTIFGRTGEATLGADVSSAMAGEGHRAALRATWRDGSVGLIPDRDKELIHFPSAAGFVSMKAWPDPLSLDLELKSDALK